MPRSALLAFASPSTEAPVGAAGVKNKWSPLLPSQQPPSSWATGPSQLLRFLGHLGKAFMSGEGSAPVPLLT